MAKPIYLDNSTTTKPSESTVQKMLPYLTAMWGSPSAPHQKGQELFPAIEDALKGIYEMLGAQEADDVIFTSCGAEAVNHVLFSAYYDITRNTGKNQFITSNIDEAPTLMSIGRLEQLGCVGKLVEANPLGYVTAQSIADAFTPRTAMVSLAWANGLTGVINPVSEIAAACKARGVILHLDATHILGKLYFDLEEVGAQLISFNGDQLHAPKGSGALYIKGGSKCSPFILGGSEQAGYRAGALNVPCLVALGSAAREVIDQRDLLCTEVARLRNKLEVGILDGFAAALPLFRDQERLPNCFSMAFPGIANEAMLYALNRKGVYASIGGGAFQQIGLVLMASGIAETVAHTAINFSLSRETNECEVDAAIEIIVDTAKRLAKLSSHIEKGKETLWD